jgi:RNA polymerase sigma-70 factor (ECF subfamily)
MGIGDGGGRMPARSTVVVGAQAVAQLFRGLLQPSDAKRRLIGGSPDAYAAVVNGSPALVVAVGDRVVGVVTFETTADGISALLSQANPDKLERATRQWSRADRGEPLPTTW